MVLYGMDVVDPDSARDHLYGCYPTLLELHEELELLWEQVEARVLGVWQLREELNAQVQAVSPRWRLDRMATIDRNILRLGAWEVLANKSAPISVVNDCIELGKRYGEKGTPSFINGLLDQLCKNHKIAMV